MKLLFPAVMLCLLLGLTGCRASGRADPSPTPLPEQWERQLHDLVNFHRVQEGLPALRYSSALARIAREHSQAMAAGEVPFSHEGIAERTKHAQRHVPLLYLGENLLFTESSASFTIMRALGGWLASPSHRETLEGCFDRAGIGLALDARGRVYITHLFVVTPVASRRCERREAATPWNADERIRRLNGRSRILVPESSR